MTEFQKMKNTPKTTQLTGKKTKQKPIHLREFPGTYSVVRLDPNSEIPIWAYKSLFFSISKTDDELSVVCESSVIPEGDFKREDDWKCIKVAGPLDFSLTGILSSIAGPLAAAKISIFAISTFDTDYILVKQNNLSEAKAVLKKAGFDFS